MLAARSGHMEVVEYLHQHAGPQSLLEKDKVSTCTTPPHHTCESFFFNTYNFYNFVVVVVVVVIVVVVVRMVARLWIWLDFIKRLTLLRILKQRG